MFGLLALLFVAQSLAQQTPGTINAAAIASAFGREGQTIGDVYKLSFPRSDLKVTVNAMPIRAGLALGSWLAFRPAGEKGELPGWFCCPGPPGPPGRLVPPGDGVPEPGTPGACDCAV